MRNHKVTLGLLRAAVMRQIAAKSSKDTQSARASILIWAHLDVSQGPLSQCYAARTTQDDFASRFQVSTWNQNHSRRNRMDLSQLFGGIAGMGILISLCVILPFLAIAGFLLISARRSSAQAQASQTWPSVMGTVTASSVEVSTSSDSDGGSTTSYYPAVTYQYDVLGHRYTSDRISFGFRVGSGNRVQAQAVADRYIAGNQIRVYYNPTNAAEAVLERTSQSSSLAKWFVIIILAVICIVVIPVVLGLGGVMVFLDQMLKSLPVK
jgi:hypothetical protein